MHAINEKSLVANLRTLSPASFDMLYTNYAPALLGHIMRLVKNREQSEEILHDGLLKIWYGIDSYDADKGRLYTWMARICKNAALDYLKSKSCNNNRVTDEIIPMKHSHLHSLQISQYVDAIGLDQWLEDIEDRYRKVIEALYLQGMSHSQASKALILPLGTVKTRVRLGLQQLRQNLDLRISA